MNDHLRLPTLYAKQKKHKETAVINSLNSIIITVSLKRMMVIAQCMHKPRSRVLLHDKMEKSLQDSSFDYRTACML